MAQELNNPSIKEAVPAKDYKPIYQPNFTELFKAELKKLKQNSESELSSEEEFSGLTIGKPHPKFQKFATYCYLVNQDLLEAKEKEGEKESENDDEGGSKTEELPEDLLSTFEMMIDEFTEKHDYNDFLRVIERAFPNIDREHVIYMFKLKELNNGECWTTVKRMGLRGIFPKTKTMDEIKELERKKKIILDPSLTLVQLVELFNGDPLALITNVTVEVDERYIRFARAQLVRDFPKLTRTTINYELKEANFHYYPAYKALQKQKFKETASDELKAVYDNRPIIELEEFEKSWEYKEKLENIPYKFPIIPDIDFYMEYALIRQKNEYIVYIKEKRESDAESSGSILNVYLDCELCGETGIFSPNSLQCILSEHVICCYCARSKALQILKDVETPLIKCGVDNCTSVFFFDHLKLALPSEIHANWLAYLTTKQTKYNKDFPNNKKCVNCYMYMLASLWINDCNNRNCVSTKYQRAVKIETTLSDLHTIDTKSKWLFKIP